MDAEKGFSPTRSDKNIQGFRNKPERQLGSLRDVIDEIKRDSCTPSVESIATHLSSMHMAQRAPALLALQRTRRNLYVQRVVTGIQAKLKVGQPEGYLWAGSGPGGRTLPRLGLGYGWPDANHPQITSALFVFDRFAGRGRKSDDAELATTIPHRKMAVDLSNRFDRRRRACRGYDQRGEPAIRQISGKDHLNSR